MTFAWTNFSKNTLRELARASRLKVTQAHPELIARYGEPPSDELVAVTWLTMRDGWVLRTPEARVEIVERLRAAHLGRSAIKVKTRPGQMEYLKSCRMSDTLKRIVHEVFLDVGSRSFDGVDDSAAVPELSGETAEVGQVLRQACAALTSDVLSFLEYSVCTEIGSAMRGQAFPVDPDDRFDVAGSVASAALTAIARGDQMTLEWNGEVPAHRAWVVEGARRLANDRAACDRAIGEYFDQVSQLVIENGDFTNVQLTSTSLFFTMLAFGNVVDVPQDAQVELIRGLTWLMGAMEDQVDESDDPPVTEPAGEPSADRSPAGLSLGDFIDSVLRQRPGLIGPHRASEDSVAWLINVGSATVHISLLEPPDAIPMLRFQSRLLGGVTSSHALLETVNGINRADSLHKVYVTDDAVVMEYDQIVDHLTSARLVSTINTFMSSADQYDTILQDRFGGATQAADVKAQFSV